MDNKLNNKLTWYQLTVVLSLTFALIGFSYNVWRMEASEQNNTIRTACFEMLLELSSLEQLVYSAHYDKNTLGGNPRKGWVKVGLISDLSILTADSIRKSSSRLYDTWSHHWSTMADSRQSTDKIVAAIDMLRSSIKSELQDLQ